MLFAVSAADTFTVNQVSNFGTTCDLMSPGDTLIVEDGFYMDSDNSFASIPSGDSGNYTVLRAETDFGVKIDGDFCPHGVIELDGKSHVLIQGIVVDNGGDGGAGGGIVAYNSDHIKILNCASGNVFGSGHSIGFTNSSYCLVEGCHAWGSGRYQFGVSSGGESHHIIFRRNVARFDALSVTEPCASFSAYNQHDIVFQNNIAIDGGGGGPNVEHFYRGFFTPNGHVDIWFYGNIALNLDGYGMMTEGSTNHFRGHFVDNVIWDITWDVAPHSGAFLYRDDGQAILDHFTIGEINGAENGARCTAVEGSSAFTNSIFYNVQTANFRPALDRFSNPGNNWNVFYGNVLNYSSGAYIGSQDWCSQNANEVDPTISGLLYLVRVEDGSLLKGAGSFGTDRGATIIKSRGISGTLYGETGWNDLTEEDLWPWENEDIIHANFSSYSAHGFAVEGQTLTKYIWEYLGNPIPEDIYGELPPTFPSILVHDTYIDFGTSLVDTLKFEYCVVENEGDGDLIISEVLIPYDDVILSTILPLTIAPQSIDSILFTFHPDFIVDLTEPAIIVNNDEQADSVAVVFDARVFGVTQEMWIEGSHVVFKNRVVPVN